MAQETYIDRIASALTDVLDRAANGSADRLAGYARNIDFWLDEFEHCLRVIDGYEQRHRRFEAAQQEVVEKRGPMQWDERGWRSPPSEIEPSSTAAELGRTRERVVASMTKFLDRCGREGMIGQKKRYEAQMRGL